MGQLQKLVEKKNETIKEAMYNESVVQMFVDFSILTPETQSQ